MTLLRPDVPTQPYTPAQFVAENQSTAFSQEILKLSQNTSDQTPLQAATPADKAPPITGANAAVDKLPSLTLEEKSKPADAKLSATTNAIIDIGLGTAAIIAGEAAVSVLTKNPQFAAMALETLQTGGKMALMTSPKFMVPIGLTTGAVLGSATIGRHYAVEGLTGQSESWMNSASHVSYGASAFMVGRYVHNQFTPVVPSA